MRSDIFTRLFWSWRDEQSQMAYFFIMQESIDRVVIEIKSYLELHNSLCVT